MTAPSSAREPAGRRPRILFVAEAVTLAHVARPIALARGLDPARFEVILAADPRHRPLWGALPCATRPIRSIASERFLDALDRGRPPYDLATLRTYARDDLELLGETRPDAVIGDFRLSLAVSARAAGIPYLAIINAYWSPYARRRIPLPELPLTRHLGVPAARVLFRLARPLAFAAHAHVFNRLRREYGQRSLGPDLRRVYTEADHVLYADPPELVPTPGRPAHHHHLGVILWSPPVERPTWWADLPGDRPILYVTLGSSGRGTLLSATLEALAGLPVVVLAADPTRSHRGAVPPNARLAPYLPGHEAAARARLVICNGGSPTTHQALAVGTPVLGLAGNMDQHLNMDAIEDQGAGLLLRSDSATPVAIRAAVGRLLADPASAAAAKRLASAISRSNAPGRLQAIFATQLGLN